jgi:hypothetical protein
MSTVEPGRAPHRSSTPDEAVVVNMVSALQQRRLDDAMAYFDDASVLRVGASEFKGIDAIRVALAGQVQAVDASTHVELGITTEAAGRVVLRWQVFDRPGGDLLAHGTDYFAVEGRIIRAQEVVAEHG